MQVTEEEGKVHVNGQAGGQGAELVASALESMRIHAPEEELRIKGVESDINSLSCTICGLLAEDHNGTCEVGSV